MTAVDPYKKVVKTARGDFRFDEAILMAPHQAGDMVWMADLIAKDKDGKPTGWGSADPLYLWAREDRDVFVIGDAILAPPPSRGPAGENPPTPRGWRDG